MKIHYQLKNIENFDKTNDIRPIHTIDFQNYKVYLIYFQVLMKALLKSNNIDFACVYVRVCVCVCTLTWIYNKFRKAIPIKISHLCVLLLLSLSRRLSPSVRRLVKRYFHYWRGIKSGVESK